MKTRNQNHDDDEASSSSRKKRFKTYDNGGVGPWSHLSNDVLFLVTMQLGIFDFLSFSRVCKSWRSFALCNRKSFMASKPPMSMLLSSHGFCCLEDFEGRKLKTIIPHSSGRKCVGLTCGYLILFGEETFDFWLVNPITRHELYFPAFCLPNLYMVKATLVFSSSLNDWVFVVSHKNSFNLWFSISGKGAWNHIPSSYRILDLHTFKGKIYTLNKNNEYRVCEMSLNPEPKLTFLEMKNISKLYVSHPVFISSGENLYVMD
ncbi:unnamed protein product [Lactuca virosa]|uniref:F-box domain-containing protein n=1 Tax=Lactuca virosa TaxID=75947 RepID=A0AAU9M5H0_9ASTR|nr:unnamed protein product [Lactuca virosa]